MHLTKKKKIQYREVTNDYDEESSYLGGKISSYEFVRGPIPTNNDNNNNKLLQVAKAQGQTQENTINIKQYQHLTTAIASNHKIRRCSIYGTSAIQDA